jgi:hypothetical protein
MRIKRQLLASALVVLTALSGSVATAQVPFLGGSLKRLAFQAAAKQLAPVVSEASPINLDWNNLYPTVDAPPGSPFRAHGDLKTIRAQHRYLLSQMAKHPNAPVPLRPGDYVFFMRAYCTHAGPQAIPAHPQEPWPEAFEAAPLKGRRASVLPALYARAAQANIPYRQTQILVWSITNGVPFEQMPPDQQAMFNKLVPQYKGVMEGDPVQRIRARWETMRHKMPLLPSLDAAADKLGAVGTTFKSLEDAQRATIANANDFEQSKATLAPKTVMPPMAAPVKSWSKVDDRVYTKLKLPRNYHGIGSIVALFVRVLPAAAVSSERPAKGSARDFDMVAQVTDAMAANASATFGGWVYMPAQPGVQPLTLQTTDVTVGPATPNGPATNNNPPPPNIPPDLIYNGIQWINDNINFWTQGKDSGEDKGVTTFGPTVGPYVP